MTTNTRQRLDDATAARADANRAHDEARAAGESEAVVAALYEARLAAWDAYWVAMRAWLAAGSPTIEDEAKAQALVEVISEPVACNPEQVQVMVEVEEVLRVWAAGVREASGGRRDTLLGAEMLEAAGEKMRRLLRGARRGAAGEDDVPLLGEGPQRQLAG